MKIVRVGLDTPRFTALENGALSPKRRAILAAMRYAVEHTEPGTLIVQEDVDILSGLELAAKYVKPGYITCLNPPRTEDHTCPQAFIISDEPTRQQLITAWQRPNIQACMSWAEIPKNYPPIPGMHNGRAWR